MWKPFFEHLQTCGRDASVFILAILAVMSVALATPVLGQWSAPVMGGCVAAFLGWLTMAVKASSRGCERLGPMPPLSALELRKARERLRRQPMANGARATQRLGASTSAGAVRLRRA